MNTQIFYPIPADELLALTAYGEAASEGAEGMMAVINVVLNRMKDMSSYADSTILSQTGSAYHAVVLKPYQFSAFNATDPVRAKLESLLKTFTTSVNSNTTLNQAYQLAQLAVQGQLADNTGGATHYHTTAVAPSWSKTIDYIGQLGNHLFYSALPVWERVRTTVTEAYETVSPYMTYILLGIIGLGGWYYIKRRK